MQITRTLHLSALQCAQLTRTWNRVYPLKLSYPSSTDFERYLAGLADKTHILVSNDDGEIVAWCCDFVRDGERWFALLVDDCMQGQGLGTELLDDLKMRQPVLNGWVIDHDREMMADGGLYQSPLQFYLKKGFAVLPEIRI